jgi:F-type H+-transporting ATPase subunit c
MTFLGMLALAVGLGLPIAVVGGALAQGKAAAAALEGMARQPEAMGKMQTAMILSLAFIESLVIFTFVFLFLLNSKVPTVSQQAVDAAMSQSGK